MKKIGIAIFIIALGLGLIISNIFSFGNSFSNAFSFSLWSKIKGSGNIATEKREVAKFDSVDVGGVFQVEIVAQKDFGVIVEADDNLLPFIVTEVRGNTLNVKTKKRKRFSTSNPIRIKVFAPNIENLEVSGVAKVSLSNIDNDSLKIDSSGASKINLEGKSKNLNIDISGATRVNAKELKTEKASVDASGASKAYVFASNELKTDLSGASKVVYSGNPTNIDKKLSGASSIKEN